MVSVIHYTVALYPIELKANASKKKYKQVFIYYLLGQQKSRLVELERCFEEAIGLHHGLCWLCEVFLQIFSSVFWYCCSTELQNSWTVCKWFLYTIFFTLQTLMIPSDCKKGNTTTHCRDNYLTITFRMMNHTDLWCQVGAVIWCTDYYPNTVRNSRL